MVDLMYCLKNLIFFYILLLYYYTNLNSSIIFCLLSRDIYLSFGISNSFCECNSSEDFFETLVILSAIILLPIKSPVASAVFLIAFLKQFLLHLL